MRTRTAAALVLATVLALLPGVAGADTRVPVFGTLPAGMTAVQTPCDHGGNPTGDPLTALDPSLVTGPGSAPLHDSSLELWSDADRVPGLAIDLPSSAALATMQVSAYRSAVLHVGVRDAGGTLTMQGGFPGRTHQPGGWADFDAGGAFPADLGPVTVFLWFGSCYSSPGAVPIDALSLGDADDVTTYDFEDGAIRLDGVSASYAVGAARRSLYCMLSSPSPTEGLVPVVGETVVLESRPHSGGTFAVTGTAVTTGYGQATFHDRPRTTTDYRCRYDGNDGTSGHPYPAVASQATTQQVQTHLTVHARRTDRGRGVVVAGSADPPHPGTRVALHVRRITWDFGASRVIDRSRISRRGDYELAAPLRGGIWELFVTVASAPGNSAGRSASRYVR